MLQAARPERGGAEREDAPSGVLDTRKAKLDLAFDAAAQRAYSLRTVTNVSWPFAQDQQERRAALTAPARARAAASATEATGGG